METTFAGLTGGRHKKSDTGRTEQSESHVLQ